MVDSEISHLPLRNSAHPQIKPRESRSVGTRSPASTREAKDGLRRAIIVNSTVDFVELRRNAKRLKEASYSIAVGRRHREKLNTIANSWIARYDDCANRHFLFAEPESDIQPGPNWYGGQGPDVTAA